MKRTLEHLRANPEYRARFSMVHIWSGEHRAWWRQSGGYTDDISQAGVFTMDEAWADSSHCCRKKRIQYHSVQRQKPAPLSPADRLAAAARDFGAAHHALTAANCARIAYWRANGGGIEPDEEGHGRYGHRYQECVRPLDHYGTESPMCAICIGSQPLHNAVLAAARRRGAALRSLLRLTRPPPPSACRNCGAETDAEGNVCQACACPSCGLINPSKRLCSQPCE